MKVVLGHLMKLLRSPTLSARDLQAATGESQGGDPRPPACRRLIRHLLLNFVLWAPGGHAVAWEVISLVSVPFLSILVFIHMSPKGLAFEEYVCQDACPNLDTQTARQTSGMDPRTCPVQYFHVTEEKTEGQR